MPFITIEIPEKVEFNFRPFVKEMHQYLSTELSTPIEKFKTKIFRLPETYVGNGDAMNAYARLKIELLAGRDKGKLQACGKELLKRLTDAINVENPGIKCRFTMDFSEMNLELFFPI